MIGFKDDKKTMMEEIKTESNDILALEGTVRGSKMRIILVYMDSDKKKSGKNYKRNKKNPVASRKRIRSGTRYIHDMPGRL